MLKRDRSDAAGIPVEMLRVDYPLMKTVNNRCVALSGEVGKCVSCTIYRDRPTACSKFVAGSMLCIEAREKVLGIKKGENQYV